MNHPNYTIMQNTTIVEVKCDCTIPFRSELESRLEEILSSPIEGDTSLQDLPHIRNIKTIIQSKIIFVKITNPVKTRSRLLDNVKQLFHKEVVGTIKGDKNEITLILV